MVGYGKLIKVSGKRKVKVKKQKSGRHADPSPSTYEISNS
jgi:hypothetical protein